MQASQHSKVITKICRSDMDNYKEKYSAFVAFLLVDVIDNNRDIQESDEDEVWKLGYHEATDFVLRRMHEIDQQLKTEKENQ